MSVSCIHVFACDRFVDCHMHISNNENIFVCVCVRVRTFVYVVHMLWNGCKSLNVQKCCVIMVITSHLHV